MPAVLWDPAHSYLELTFSDAPAEAIRLQITSPAWVSFVDDRVVSLDLLNTPDIVSGVCSGEEGPRFDAGWLWVPLGEERATSQLTGIADAEITMSKDQLHSVRLQLGHDG